MTACPTCSFDNRLGVRFCEECGNQLADSIQTPPGCAQCGSQLREGVSFCEECGQRVAAVETQETGIRCSECGAANREGVRFCERCGQGLVPVVPEVAQSAPEPDARAAAEPEPHLEAMTEPEAEQTSEPESAPETDTAPEPELVVPVAIESEPEHEASPHEPIGAGPEPEWGRVVEAALEPEAESEPEEEPLHESEPEPEPEQATPSPMAVSPIPEPEQEVREAKSARCSSCGQANRSGVRYCEHCGDSLVVETVPEPVAPVVPIGPYTDCEACGHPNRPGIKFCEQCAAEIGASKPRQTDRSSRETGWGRQLGIAAGAAAVIAVGVLVGTQLLSREAASPDDDPTPTTAAASQENPPSTPSDVVEQGPSLNLDDFASQAGFVDLDASPNTGFEIEGDDGSVFSFDGRYWNRRWEGSDGTAMETREGWEAGSVALVANQLEFVFNSEAPPETRTWAEDIVSSMPGISVTEGSWRVDNLLSFLTDLRARSVEGGAWATNQSSGFPMLIDYFESRYVFEIGFDGYSWVLDEIGDALWFVAPNADGDSVVAGAIGPDLSGGYRWLDSPMEDSATNQALSAALDGLGRENLAEFGITDLTAALSEAGSPRAIPALATPADSDARLVDLPSPPGRLHFGLIDLAKKAGKKAGGGLMKGWKKVKDPLWDYAVEAPLFVPMQAGTLIWDGLTYYYPTDRWPILTLEKNCGARGPWHPDKGAPPIPALVVPPSSGLTYAEAELMLELARLWMPMVKFSKDELCGEVLGIVAKVFPYDDDGDYTTNLQLAARVEITYTVMFAEDGGRFFGGAAHAGDNEGFSIGLLRSDRTAGRCGESGANRFELYGAKSAAHMQHWFPGLDVAQDSDTADGWAGKCPPQGDNDYFVWVSESKHGIYLNRTTCEDEVLWLEECEFGRDPVDLSQWVQLWVASPGTTCPDPKNDDDPKVCNWGDQVQPPCNTTLKLFDKQQPWFCAARGSLRQDGESDRYWVGYDFWEASPAAVRKPTIRVKTTCNSIGQSTEVTLTNFHAREDVTMLVVDDSGSLPRVLADLSGSTTSEGTRTVHFNWDGLNYLGSRVKVTASMAPMGLQSISAEVIAESVAGCWPPELEIPSLQGLTEQEARSRLGTDFGLQVVGSLPLASGHPLDGLVADQDPLAGTKAARGSVVEVWIGDAAEEVIVPPKCAGIAATIVGTSGDDYLVGTSGADVIVGLGGDDLIEASGGNDLICGGDGADSLFGDSGDDVIYGEGGDDYLEGGGGSDALDGGSGGDWCDGESTSACEDGPITGYPLPDFTDWLISEAEGWLDPRGVSWIYVEDEPRVQCGDHESVEWEITGQSLPKGRVVFAGDVVILNIVWYTESSAVCEP